MEAIMGSQHFIDHLTGIADQIRRAATASLANRMEAAIERTATALQERRPLLVCGNGGSASDSMHIAGELVGRFLLERPALKVISLVADAAVVTAWSNDYSYDDVFARQVEAYGESGGVLLGLSTSGNSKNVIAAFEQARRMNMVTIALTGEGGGRLAPLADILLDVPSKSTPRIQEMHICLYHYLCEKIEERVTPEAAGLSSTNRRAAHS
jgi:D-sedoheptulose 7-phosphate isomerase